MKPLKLLSLVAAGGLGFLMLSPSASAVVIPPNFDITSDHSSSQTVTGGTLPNTGIELTVLQGANFLTVDATFAPGWGIITNGGDAASFMFALPNALSATITGLAPGFTAVTPVSTVPGLAMNGNIHDGGINGLTGYGVIGGSPSSPATTLFFTINATGITLASLMAGGYSCSGGPTCPTQTPLSGIFFADVRNAQGQTGVVDFGPISSQTPLPPAALLFGSALVGLGILGRRRRKDPLAQA